MQLEPNRTESARLISAQFYGRSVYSPWTLRLYSLDYPFCPLRVALIVWCERRIPRLTLVARPLSKSGYYYYFYYYQRQLYRRLWQIIRI